MSIYKHACHPENQRVNADGSERPICAGQAVSSGCYAPELSCGGDTGYRQVGGELVLARPTAWLDRLVKYDAVTLPMWPGAPLFDKGGFLDGAKRKWGIADQRTLDVTRLGDVHGVSLDTAGQP